MAGFRSALALVLLVSQASACVGAPHAGARNRPGPTHSSRSPATAGARPLSDASDTDAGSGRNVFAEGELLDVRLTLDPDTLQQLEAHGDREKYVRGAARLTSLSGVASELPEIGVRHKGSYSLEHCWDEHGGVRSYADECAKLSFKLRFDKYREDARVDGLKSLNLHASSADSTQLRELIAYRTFRDAGVDAPRAIPARLTVNGRIVGLFIAVENVDGRYTRAHYPAGGGGNLYKEVWPNTSFSDQELRAALETNKKEADVSDLRAFAQAVAGSTAQTFAADMEPFLEIEALLRYLAVDRALRNWDGVTAFYSPRSSHNFCWYHDDGPRSRFHLIPWDLDQSLWAYHPYTDPPPRLTAPPVPDLDMKPRHCRPRPVWQANGTERVLPARCDKLLGLLLETRWERFAAIGRELLAGPLAAQRLQRLADAFTLQLAPLVAQDPTLDVEEWQRSLREFSEVLHGLGPSFAALLTRRLTDETSGATPPG